MTLVHFKQIMDSCIDVLSFKFSVFGYNVSLLGFIGFGLAAFLVLYLYYGAMK